ncbi:hypothetical protein Rsub_06963 [Raphidocelis subcapitata]|uniref:Uncharacterized protein n=1 Tax=Raphidocelis subcapitata TaxID=307507 RepID=A0A2V0P388_9CHLO|nr:hypothetical protein Rsub_06963 [Raphidocelis subcapitata]|eukprot:GBF94341.1 hypothetical protein Rsub_06963 [Raphidocelis subcapitata]
MASTSGSSEQGSPAQPANPAANPAAGGPQVKRGGSTFNLVASPSGANLFVEPVDQYDPFAPHRKHGSGGEGLWSLMFGGCSMLPWCSPGGAAAAAPAPPVEPAATAERHYSLPPSQSMADLVLDKEV